MLKSNNHFVKKEISFMENIVYHEVLSRIFSAIYFGKLCILLVRIY